MSDRHCPGHEPNPDCDNCNGRGCMACVFREWHDYCEDDCPLCCVCDGCTPRLSPLDVVEAFIANEVGWHTNGMRVQAQELLDTLAAHGYLVTVKESSL